MQSLPTQTSGGCTCGLSMSQVTKKEQKTSFERQTGVLTERNWELGFPASFANLAPDPRTSSPPLTQGSINRHLLDLTHFTTQAILKIPFGQGWQKISGSPRQTGSALVVTQRQRVLFVPRNWSHLKTN